MGRNVNPTPRLFKISGNYLQFPIDLWHFRATVRYLHARITQMRNSIQLAKLCAHLFACFCEDCELTEFFPSEQEARRFQNFHDCGEIRPMTLDTLELVGIGGK